MAKKVKIKSKKPQGIGSKIFDVVNYLLLAILGFIMFYPMFYVFIVSISSSQYINQGLVTLFPRGINFDAYKAVFENQRIWSGYKNTFLYTGLGTLICLVLTALCAYPLSRKDFYGRKAFTVLIMITMFVNGGMIPTYLVINKLHMIKTSFQAIPDSLVESAYLDGANDITIFSKIVLPLSKPIIATMTLYYAVYHWNSYFPSMLYLNDQKKYPVQVVMRDIVIQGDTSEITGSVNIIATNYKYAVIIISIVPILLVYPLLQKYFTKGVMVGAVKG